MRKSIADFVEGKIVRLEVDDVSFTRGGPADASLGECEGTIRGPAGEATLYERGMVVGDTSFSYEQIERVEISPTGEVAIVTDRTILVRSSQNGGALLHATLRWIGHTILRRKIAD